MSEIDSVEEATRSHSGPTRKDDQVKGNPGKEKRDALSEWEDEGGALRSDADGQTGRATQTNRAPSRTMDDPAS